MKKAIMVLFTIFLLLFSFPAVAQEESTPDLPESDGPLEDVSEELDQLEEELAGTTPDDFFYFVDKAFDNLVLALTFDTDKRVEKELRIAEERLAEARAMALDENYEAVAEAQEEHDKVLTKLKDEVKEISDDDPVAELKKELEVEKKIKKHTERVEDFKDEISVKIKISGDITAEQQDLIASILASLEGRTGEIIIEIDNEKGKTKTKIEEETGRSGDEVEDELEEELEDEDEEDELEIEVEIEDGKADIEVKVAGEETDFVLDTTDVDEIVAEIVARTGLSEEIVRANLELEEEEEGEDEKDEEEELGEQEEDEEDDEGEEDENDDESEDEDEDDN